jgi:hypothetical protein
MKEEYIMKKKLESSIMPYLLSSSQMRHSTNFLFYHLYDYTKEVFTLLAGYGISYPILQNYNVSTASTSGQLSIAGILLGVCAGVLRFAYGRETVAQRVIGQKKLMRSLSVLRTKTLQALSEKSLQDLISIQKELTTVINNNVQEGIYFFEDCFNERNLELAKTETERLLRQFNIEVDESKEKEIDEDLPDQNIQP